MILDALIHISIPKMVLESQNHPNARRVLSRLLNHDARCTHLGSFTFPYQNTVLERQDHPNARRNPVAEGHRRRDDDDGGTGQAFAAGQEVPSLPLFVNFFLSARSAGHFVTTFPSP